MTKGPGSPKPSWKNNGNAGGARRQSGPSWKRERDAPRAADRPRSKKARLFRFGVAFLGCFAAIVWLILQLFQPSPANVALIGTDYAETLAVPANVQGLNVLRSVQQLGGKATGLILWGSRKLNVRKAICDLSDEKGWRDAWKTEISDLHKPFREKTLVVYLSLHGAVDPSTGPYLLVGSGASDTSRLPFKDVLAALKDFPTDKDIILVLDAAQIETDWNLGIISNDFARKLTEMKADIEAIPNLWVLASCDADQHSWRARDGKLSIFGQYFQAALEGAGTSDSGRVNLGGLFDYVKKEVERQAAESWGATQTPILISKKDPKQAAKVQINVVAKRGEKPETLASPPVSPLLEPFAKRWATLEQLSRSVPSPAVYAPYHWRAYRDGVVRYEELLRAGHPTRPQRLEAAMDAIEKQLEAMQVVGLPASERLTLTMPNIAGRPSAPPKASWTGESTKLWNAAGTPELTKAWEAFMKNESQAEEPALKARLYDFVLEKLSAAPDDLTTATNKIRSLVQQVRPRPMPAEIQFASSLARMLPANAKGFPNYAEHFARVLKVRRVAERVAVAATESGYAYGERVLPWIRPLVDEGDTARRHAEDLLFSSEPKDWFKAADFLTDATNRYEKAATRADMVRKALATRDQAFANLPAYSRWAVDRISEVDASSPAPLELAVQTEALWGRLYELADLLDRDPDLTTSFTTLTTTVETGLTNLEKAYGTDMGDLTGVGGSGLPRDWDLDRALAVPTTRIPNRASLTAPRRSGGGGKKPDAATRNVRARLQARMAMASIGPWFDGQSDASEKSASEAGFEKAEAVTGRLEAAIGAESKSDPTKRAEALTWVGDQIGRRFRAMPGQIDRLAEGLSQLDTRVGKHNVQVAERLERIVPAATAPSRTPTADNRQRAVHDILVAQSIRSWTDHWLAEDDTLDDPYYKVSGLAYLKDAGLLYKNSPAVAAATARLQKPGNLVFDEPPAVSLTSEASLPLAYSVQPAEGADVPPGFPVAWIEPGKDLQVVPASNDLQFRRIIEFGANPRPVTLSIASPLIPKLKDRPTTLTTVDPSSVTVRGFYRGQPIERRTPVGIYPVPEVTQLKIAPPTVATVAVRADDGVIQQFGEGNGAISIILDCSGSMWEKDIELKDSRYFKAVEALKAVLNSIPTGTKVSIWVFGEKSFKGVNFANTKDSIQQLRAMTEWDPAMTGEIIDRARTLEPQFYTPLVRTMLKARDDLALSGRSLRTLLVLSDGADQPEKGLLFPQDTEINPQGLQIEGYLPLAFNTTHIRINMVFFQTDPEELGRVEQNFSGIRGFDPPGFIAQAKDLEGLIQLLKRGSDQKITYRILRENNDPIKARDSERQLVSATPDRDQWYIPALNPGVDKVQVETDRTLEQRFSIDKGDRLLIRLGVLPEGGLGFRRGLWSEDLEGRAMTSPDQGNGWRMSLAQNQSKREGGIGFLVGLERTTDVAKLPLHQPKPFDLWVEVQTPKGSKPAGGLIWGNLDGYPAPSWGIDSMTWPVDPKKVPFKPAIDAWWSSDKEAPADATLEKTKDFDSPLDDSQRGLSGRTVSVDGQVIKIESFTVEDTRLVIRMSHAKDRPVVIRLDGMAPSRQEHRFYREASKYTAIFSETNRDEVQTRLSRLQFVSIDRLKREATKRNDHVSLTPNDPPAPNDVRPSPTPLDR